MPWLERFVIPSSPSESKGRFRESVCPSIGSVESFKSKIEGHGTKIVKMADF